MEECEKIKGIALIDSLHSTEQVQTLDAKIFAFFNMNAMHWETSNEKLGSRLEWKEDALGCTNLSSGTSIKEETIYCAMNSIFDFHFSQRLNQ